jgi:GNAT superfamily N-acetyltransferase
MKREKDDREAARTTRTGVRIVLRPVRIDDKDLLHSFVKSLSEEAIYLRFFRHVEAPENLVQRLVEIDHTKQTAVLALIKHGSAEEIVGVGRYFIDLETATAELVMTVRDDYQNKGIGRELLSHLISLARGQGLIGLSAQVLADNVSMFRLLRSFEGTEYRIQRRLEAGVFHFDMVFK